MVARDARSRAPSAIYCLLEFASRAKSSSSDWLTGSHLALSFIIDQQLAEFDRVALSRGR